MRVFSGAVDYLAKNVSLSTQRRMKLGDHSAVLGLLQVETGQAYWSPQGLQLHTYANTYTQLHTPGPAKILHFVCEAVLLPHSS